MVFLRKYCFRKGRRYFSYSLFNEKHIWSCPLTFFQLFVWIWNYIQWKYIMHVCMYCLIIITDSVFWPDSIHKYTINKAEDIRDALPLPTCSLKLSFFLYHISGGKLQSTNTLTNVGYKYICLFFVPCLLPHDTFNNWFINREAEMIMLCCWRCWI